MGKWILVIERAGEPSTLDAQADDIEGAIADAHRQLDGAAQDYLIVLAFRADLFPVCATLAERWRD